LRAGALMNTCNVAFIYWGRRGGMCRFTLEAAHVASEIDGLNAHFSVSTANELYPEFRSLGDPVFSVDTFHSPFGAILNTPRVFFLRRKLIAWLTKRNVKSVIVLMPHIWTPLIAGAVKACGIRYTVVVHDAKPHPGDATGLIYSWLLNDIRAADTVVALSDWVKSELVGRGIAPAERTRALFMPDNIYPSSATERPPRRQPGQPLRILFFGRLLRYKGIPLFVEAMEILAARGISVEISVCGEGDLRSVASRLEALKAKVINKWLDDDEVGDLLACHDVAVLTHIEASQSGIISAAMGAGLPVVTTPVGGLAEQVQTRRAGLVSARADPQAVADCVGALALDDALYHRIVDQIGFASRSFSVKKFLRDLVDLSDGVAPSAKARQSTAVIAGPSEKVAGACGPLPG
jgi:glycosyltransferase involved in cell wall biosynthesis